MLNEHILSITTFVPALGAILIALLPRQGKVIQWCALLVSLLTFALTLHLPAHYDYGTRSFQFVEDYSWITSPNIRYHMGIDGISLWLVVLTGFLAPIGVLASWTAISTRSKEFYFFFLLQQTAMLGVFTSLDIFLYYGFWELSLIPMAILIAMFGRTKGPAAAIKFFLYTFIPSALFLVAILYLYAKSGTFDFVTLQHMLATGQLGITQNALAWTAFAFLFAFAVKVPVFPLHGWLGDVFSEAPTAMAMVVAGKLGLYSILRFNLGLFPAQARLFAPWMIALAVIGIVYGSLVALAQKDLKRLTAFATLAALSFCILGIFCFSVAGLDGAVYQTLNEGLSGGALLLLLGFLYERYGTYEMPAYGGLAARLPWMVAFFVITSLSLAGLPLLNGFVGEFLVLSSSFATHTGWAAVATTGVILSAAFLLTMVQNVFYGKQSALVQGRSTIRDINAREHLAVWPFMVLMLVMGTLSPYWIKAIEPAVRGLASNPFGLHYAAHSEVRFTALPPATHTAEAK
ncbi:NuoM family protein [Acidipila sp. EB88]|uniref:complex I subunit 4 family protein n=1 Tax=Acidipila sp. EB88 TaxID=2305226 RepID=UPI000F5D7B06|nr:NADH-quinone oxidoreductase subunit M [Acidipila sp. EB88]RRA50279.1 NADH-quinone oxidoreductase subunit M [Acidipila sp. EB88]